MTSKVFPSPQGPALRARLFACKKEGRALGAFNCASFDMMLGVAGAACEAGVPCIVQTSEGLVRRLGPALLKGLFDLARAHFSAECFLHLDHCRDADILRACVDAGWDMVMFDGSRLPFRENCLATRECAAYARVRNVAVEAELGRVTGAEDGVEPGEAPFPSSGDVFAMVKATGVDCLAVGFGNAHGERATVTGLRWDVLREAASESDIPLVLHGGTGFTEDEYKKAVACGVAKINISTALKKRCAEVVGRAELREAVGKDPSVLHRELAEAVKESVLRYLRLFTVHPFREQP